MKINKFIKIIIVLTIGMVALSFINMLYDGWLYHIYLSIIIIIYGFYMIYPNKYFYIESWKYKDSDKKEKTQ